MEVDLHYIEYVQDSVGSWESHRCKEVVFERITVDP